MLESGSVGGKVFSVQRCRRMLEWGGERGSMHHGVEEWWSGEGKGGQCTTV